MNADENKERAASEEREEARRPGAKPAERGGERMRGRASRPDRGPTRGKRTTGGTVAGAAGAIRGAAKSLLRLTPAGDAARMWLPIAITLLVVTFVFFAVGGPLQFVWLLAVDVFYGLFLVLTWGAMWLSTPADVRRWALAQKLPRSRWRRFVEVIISDRRVFSGGAGMITIIGFSVGGVGLALALLPRGDNLGAEPLRALLCVLGVLLSWALLHTSYAMYYAHLYYRDPRKAGGMEFPGEEEPAALDFAYFAFAIGTAFATSDVSVGSGEVRRTVLIHGVLAFFYYATIFALVVNLVIGSV